MGTLYKYDRFNNPTSITDAVKHIVNGGELMIKEDHSEEPLHIYTESQLSAYIFNKENVNLKKWHKIPKTQK